MKKNLLPKEIFKKRAIETMGGSQQGKCRTGGGGVVHVGGGS